MSSPEPATISVILPLYNNAHHLTTVLPPLVDAVRSGAVSEVVVVDDSSSDDGPARCRQAGLTVHSSGGRRGPAACRNLGAQASSADILLFIDSDVVMYPQVPERVRGALATNPGRAAVFGSYDSEPPAAGIVSRYRNLLHHYTHQCGDPQANTFWAGCGAVRRQAFVEVGGFDAGRYPRPSIEDIELGYRLRRHGHSILLDRDLLCTHLKRWTLRSMVTTDVFDRALPWGRLLLEPDQPSRDLNLNLAERLKAVLALALWGTLALAPFYPPALLLAGLLLVAAIAANAGFYRLARRRMGSLGGLVAVFLHQFYYLYSSLVLAYCLAERAVRRGPPGRAGTVAR